MNVEFGGEIVKLNCRPEDEAYCRQFGRPYVKALRVRPEDTENDLIKSALAFPTAQGLLRRWQPWRLLNTLASTPLTPSVEGAALSLEPDGADRRALRLRASLQWRS